jgi:hypothetical protein
METLQVLDLVIKTERLRKAGDLSTKQQYRILRKIGGSGFAPNLQEQIYGEEPFSPTDDEMEYLKTQNEMHRAIVGEVSPILNLRREAEKQVFNFEYQIQKERLLLNGLRRRVKKTIPHCVEFGVE